MKYLCAASRRARFSSVVLLAVPILSIGCGTHSTSVPATSEETSDLTGAWLFTNSGSYAVLATALLSNAGALAGSATAYGCGATPEQTTVSGTVTAAGEVVLHTGRLSGGELLELHGKLGADRKSVEGTLAAVGGKCSLLSAGSGIQGRVYAPVHGSYTGTFTGSDGESTPVTAVLSQNIAAGPGGSYTLSGSVAFPDSPCLSAATINAAQSTVTGGALSAVYTSVVNGQTVTIRASGTADPDATHLSVTQWAITGGSCDGYNGTGVLTLR